MTKLEKLRTAYVAAIDARKSANDAVDAARNAYQAEFRVTQKELTND